MISFIKEAIREMDHVVWPTQNETKKYFTIVTSMIVIATIVLFAFGTLVSTGLFAVRNVLPHDVAQAPVTDTQTEDVLEKLPVKKNASASGTTQNGSASTSTGATSASGTSTPNK